MPAEVQSELCRQNLIPCFPHSRRSIVAEHPLVLLEQLLMNEKVCVLCAVFANDLLVTSCWLCFMLCSVTSIPMGTGKSWNFFQFFKARKIIESRNKVL